MIRICLFLIAVLLPAGAACRKGAGSAPADSRGPEANVDVSVPVTPAPIPTPEPAASDVGPGLGTEPIEYEGYRLTREVKTAKWDEKHDVETDYGVLKYGPKTVMSFDASPTMFGNEIAFGMFPFLGPERKQFYVELTQYRASEEWLVEVRPRFRVLFHSADYDLWSGAHVEDIDHDGIYEISALLSAFDGFDLISHADSPDVPIPFKYSSTAKRYLPASSEFRDYVLKGIEEEIAGMRAGDRVYFRGRFFQILLKLIYAGEEQRAWAFFDKEYNLDDKKEFKGKIRQQLRREPIFRFLDAHRAT